MTLASSCICYQASSLQDVQYLRLWWCKTYLVPEFSVRFNSHFDSFIVELIEATFFNEWQGCINIKSHGTKMPL